MGMKLAAQHSTPREKPEMFSVTDNQQKGNSSSRIVDMYTTIAVKFDRHNVGMCDI